MSYGDPILDPGYHVVYVPWAKKAFGISQESGIYTCVPQNNGLTCVDGPVIGQQLPAAGYCHKSCGVEARCSDAGARPAPDGGDQLTREPAVQNQMEHRPDPSANYPNTMPEECRTEYMASIRSIDLSGKWTTDDVAEILRCWLGKNVKTYCFDNVILEGQIAGIEISDAPSISIWTPNGLKTRLISELARVDLL